jgi:hypothetical protein
VARGAAGQLLFEEETVVREHFLCTKTTTIAVVTKIRVAAFLFSEAERQVNGTAAVGQPTNGPDAKALLDPATLLRKGIVLAVNIILENFLLTMVLLVWGSCSESHVDGTVASE